MAASTWHVAKGPFETMAYATAYMTVGDGRMKARLKNPVAILILYLYR